MRRDAWIPVVAVGTLMVTLALLPPERHLGRLLVPIYVHGALVRTGVFLFLAGALTAVVALVLGEDWAWRWTRTLQITALGSWGLGFLISFYPSYVAWGTAIAWSEPRTQMVIRVLAVAIIVFGLARWLGEPAAIAGASILLGLAVPLLIWQTGVIRHPVDPIGTSPSLRFQLMYVIIVLCVVVLALWVTYRLAERRAATGSER